MVCIISRDAHGHTIADFCTGRASLRGHSPSHLPSPAETRLSHHHFVRPSCYLASKFPHPRHLTSRNSTHLRQRWDVFRHQSRCDCIVCTMSQLALYEIIRTDPIWPVDLWDRRVGVLSCSRGSVHVIGSVTATRPAQRFRTGQFAQVPILLGNLQDDGTVLTYNTSIVFLDFSKSSSVALQTSYPPIWYGHCTLD